MKNVFWGGRFCLCARVDCALVGCTHTHTKPSGGHPLVRVMWVLPCAVERVGVVVAVVRGVGAAMPHQSQRVCDCLTGLCG